ncbi:MAG: hypothetical protein L6R35_004304 [Caloplaca aegaea]|nr:MAG: hypothetical protein L6R35_004304 [Caloplaca aegaea]
MPPKSAQAARKQAEDVHEELQASFPMWQSTVADVEDVLDQYKLSKRPEDLNALIASETDIHQYNAELQEYFKEDTDIQKKIEDVATRLSTITEEGIEIIRQELEVTDPQAEEVKDALREMLMLCPLASLRTDEDKQFGADFHEATERHVQELSDGIKNLTGKMMRERDQMLADLRKELKIEDFHEKFRAYCRLAEIKVEEAHAVCDSLQQERDQLQTRKSGLKRSLKDERKKIADRDTTIQMLIDQGESQEEGTKELLVDLRELNHLRKEIIETLRTQLIDTKAANDKLLGVKDNALARMSASLDEKNAKIQGLEPKAKALEANQKQSEATIAGQAQELTNAREDAATTIGKLNSDNQHLESTVTEFKDTVKSLQDQLSALTVAKDGAIQDLESKAKGLQADADATLVLRNEKIRDLEDTLNGRDFTVKSLEAKVSELDAKIESLESEALTLNEAREGAIAIVKVRDDSIRDLKGTLDGRDATVKSLQDQLSALKIEKDLEISGFKIAMKTAADNAQAAQGNHSAAIAAKDIEIEVQKTQAADASKAANEELLAKNRQIDSL